MLQHRLSTADSYRQIQNEAIAKLMPARKSFLYLIQGRTNTLAPYVEWGKGDSADVLFLTYDAPWRNAIFFPNSTFAEGRNQLAETALALDQKYLYYVFVDDDTTFIEGSRQAFETDVLKKHPAIATPKMESIAISTVHFPPIPNSSPAIEPFRFSDQQLMCIHHSVMENRLIFPMLTEHASLSTFIDCHIQFVLIELLYFPHAVQFNRYKIANHNHTTYVHANHPNGGYRQYIYDWCEKHVNGSNRLYTICAPKRGFAPNATIWHKLSRIVAQFGRAIAWRIYVLGWLLFWRPKTTYSMSPKQLAKLIPPESALWRQYIP